MRSSIIPIVIFLILTNCTSSTSDKKLSEEKSIRPNTEPENPETKRDTVYIIWGLDFDTLTSDYKIRIDNDSLRLQVQTYSLNDSSITRVNNNNKEIYVDTYHDYISNISLLREKDTVLNLSVSKNTFKDSLDTEFYDKAVVRYIEYESVRSNRLYFNVALSVPDTDWLLEGKMAVFFRTDKKGKINFTGFQEDNLE